MMRERRTVRPRIEEWQCAVPGAVNSFAFCSQIGDSLTGAICHICLQLATAADEVALTEIHAVVTQDVVGGRHVEKQVRDRPRLQEGESLELQRALPGRQLDVARFRALERTCRDALQEIDRAGQPRAQL